MRDPEHNIDMPFSIRFPSTYAAVFAAAALKLAADDSRKIYKQHHVRLNRPQTHTEAESVLREMSDAIMRGLEPTP